MSSLKVFVSAVSRRSQRDGAHVGTPCVGRTNDDAVAGRCPDVHSSASPPPTGSITCTRACSDLTPPVLRGGDGCEHRSPSPPCVRSAALGKTSKFWWRTHVLYTDEDCTAVTGTDALHPASSGVTCSDTGTTHDFAYYAVADQYHWGVHACSRDHLHTFEPMMYKGFDDLGDVYGWLAGRPACPRAATQGVAHNYVQMLPRRRRTPILCPSLVPPRHLLCLLASASLRGAVIRNTMTPR